MAPKVAPRGTYWSPWGGLGRPLFHFFASLGSSGEPWGPCFAGPGVSWSNFLEFRSPKSTPGVILDDFSSIFYEKYDFFQCGIKRFFHTPSHQNSQISLIFPVPQITLSLKSSSYPIIQASNLGTAECAERLNPPHSARSCRAC